jgi:hypothetical protein
VIQRKIPITTSETDMYQEFANAGIPMVIKGIGCFEKALDELEKLLK